MYLDHSLYILTHTSSIRPRFKDYRFNRLRLSLCHLPDDKRHGGSTAPCAVNHESLPIDLLQTPIRVHKADSLAGTPAPQHQAELLGIHPGTIIRNNDFGGFSFTYDANRYGPSWVRANTP